MNVQANAPAEAPATSLAGHAEPPHKPASPIEAAPLGTWSQAEGMTDLRTSVKAHERDIDEHKIRLQRLENLIFILDARQIDELILTAASRQAQEPEMECSPCKWNDLQAVSSGSSNLSSGGGDISGRSRQLVAEVDTEGLGPERMSLCASEEQEVGVDGGGVCCMWEQPTGDGTGKTKQDDGYEEGERRKEKQGHEDDNDGLQLHRKTSELQKLSHVNHMETEIAEWMNRHGGVDKLRQAELAAFLHARGDFITFLGRSRLALSLLHDHYATDDSFHLQTTSEAAKKHSDATHATDRGGASTSRSNSSSKAWRHTRQASHWTFFCAIWLCRQL